MKVTPILLALLLNAPANAFSPLASTQINQNVIPSTSSLPTLQTRNLNIATTLSSPTSLQMSSEADSDNKSPFDFLSGLLPKGDASPKQDKPEPKLPNVVIDSDYKIALAFGAVGILIVLVTQASVYGVVQGGITLLFASFLAVQATRIRFVFDETCFELKNVGAEGDDQDSLTSSGENFVVGGENRWRYDSFVNYDFFPSRGLPILVYFKENQTPEEQWNEGPGMLDKKGGGQLHFFPAIANVDQLKEQFALRGCAKIEE